MLYLEIPCGVGYSYSDDKSVYRTGDKQTALDNVAFLQVLPKINTVIMQGQLLLQYHLSGRPHFMKLL